MPVSVSEKRTYSERSGWALNRSSPHATADLRCLPTSQTKHDECQIVRFAGVLSVEAGHPLPHSRDKSACRIVERAFADDLYNFFDVKVVVQPITADDKCITRGQRSPWTDLNVRV